MRTEKRGWPKRLLSILTSLALAIIVVPALGSAKAQAMPPYTTITNNIDVAAELGMVDADWAVSSTAYNRVTGNQKDGFVMAGANLTPYSVRLPGYWSKWAPIRRIEKVVVNGTDIPIPVEAPTAAVTVDLNLIAGRTDPSVFTMSDRKSTRLNSSHRHRPLLRSRFRWCGVRRGRLIWTMFLPMLMVMG